MLEPLVGLIVAALLGVYLLYTLLHPERFLSGTLGIRIWSVRMYMTDVLRIAITLPARAA